MKQWMFADSPSVATFTTRFVLDGSRPILLVSHDRDDGAWQFLCGTMNDPEDGRVVGLGTIVRIDPSVEALADLPVGWRATRASRSEPWTREDKTASGEYHP
jgi:hypothetical protein